MTALRSTALLAVITLCTSTHRLSAEVIDLALRLDPACAGTSSTGKGSGLFRLDTDAAVLYFDFSFQTQSSLLFSHIHGPLDDGCGAGGGGILYWFPGAETSYVGSTEGEVVLGPQEIRDLIAGRYYVNVHTSTYPDGEIRGHLVLSPKSRYITWHPSLVDDPRLAPGASLGLRVTILAMPTYPAQVGRSFWVGPPAAYPEEDASAPGRTFTGAFLQCDRYLQDWSGVGTVEITGGEIIPDATYQIDLYDAACGDDTNPACYFGARTGTTCRYGDISPPYAVGAATDQPDFRDINAQVQKFLAAPGAPTKATASLEPNTPNPEPAVSFRTIAASVSAFLAVPYTSLPYTFGPCTCPSGVSCGTSCASDLECSGGLCINDQCVDQCGRCSTP